MRRPLIAGIACLTLIAGYAAADIVDVVPGFFTRAPVSSPTGAGGAGSTPPPAALPIPLPTAAKAAEVLAHLPLAWVRP